MTDIETAGEFPTDDIMAFVDGVDAAAEFKRDADAEYNKAITDFFEHRRTHPEQIAALEGQDREDYDRVCRGLTNGHGDRTFPS